MQSTSLLPSLPGTFWSGVVAPDMIPSMGQKDLNSVIVRNRVVWNRTVFIKMTYFDVKWPEIGWYVVKQNNQSNYPAAEM